MAQPVTDDLVVTNCLPVLEATACRSWSAFTRELFEGFGNAMPDTLDEGRDALLSSRV